MYCWVCLGFHLTFCISTCALTFRCFCLLYHSARLEPKWIENNTEGKAQPSVMLGVEQTRFAKPFGEGVAWLRGLGSKTNGSSGKWSYPWWTWSINVLGIWSPAGSNQEVITSSPWGNLLGAGSQLGIEESNEMPIKLWLSLRGEGSRNLAQGGARQPLKFY